MLTIFRKEINLFFSSLIGYIALVIFLVITGLFLWVFPETNLLDYGYASLEQLFLLAPCVFMLLIPAISMRSLAEEVNLGTFEILATKPVTDWQIVLGKYFAALFLAIFAILPTFIYFYTAYQLGSPVGNIDTGAAIGSYLGLVFLAAAFCAMGIFASALTANQIVAFLLAVFLCFIFYQGFDYFSALNLFYGKADYFIQQLGINAHYNAISRGVADTRDILYFISLSGCFLYLTKMVLESRKW